VTVEEEILIIENMACWYGIEKSKTIDEESSNASMGNHHHKSSGSECSGNKFKMNFWKEHRTGQWTF